MNRHVKRLSSLLLTFALVLAIPIAFTQEAGAASKGSNVYQPVQVTNVNYYSNGKSETTVTNYVCDNNGFCTEKNRDGYRAVYTYDSKGLVISRKEFNKGGTLQAELVNTIKKGKITESKYYNYNKGNAVLQRTVTYKYKKGKKSKVTTVWADDNSSRIITYRSNGKIQKYVYTDSDESNTYSFDKKGNISSIAYKNNKGTSKTKYKNTYKNGKLVKCAVTYIGTGGTETQAPVTKYSYKKGKLSKTVETRPITEEGSKGTNTTTRVYTYNKAGLLTKKTGTTVYNTEKSKWTSSYTQTYTYKKVKVNKKAKKNVKAAVKDFSDSKTDIYSDIYTGFY